MGWSRSWKRPRTGTVDAGALSTSRSTAPLTHNADAVVRFLRRRRRRRRRVGGLAGAADVGVGVGWQRAYDARADHLIGEPRPPVDAFGDAELLVQPQQVLLHGRLGDDQ